MNNILTELETIPVGSSLWATRIDNSLLDGLFSLKGKTEMKSKTALSTKILGLSLNFIETSLTHPP